MEFAEMEIVMLSADMVTTSGERVEEEDVPEPSELNQVDEHRRRR